MFIREQFYCHKNCLFFSFQQLLKIRKRSRRFQDLHNSPFLFKKIEIMKDVSLCLPKPVNSFGAIPKKDRRKPERITFILAGIGRSCMTSRVWLLDHKANDVFSGTCAKTQTKKRGLQVPQEKCQNSIVRIVPIKLCLSIVLFRVKAIVKILLFSLKRKYKDINQLCSSLKIILKEISSC